MLNRYKFARGVPLELGLVIPGFASRFDFANLLRLLAPRRLLVVSSDDDPFSGDARELVAQAKPTFEALGAAGNLEQLHTAGPHRLDSERFRAIVDWVTACT
ncbi:MAG: hypothetical protein QM756_19010 [Polyangiaceae bacterium]